MYSTCRNIPESNYYHRWTIPTVYFCVGRTCGRCGGTCTSSRCGSDGSKGAGATQRREQQCFMSDWSCKNRSRSIHVGKLGECLERVSTIGQCIWMLLRNRSTMTRSKQTRDCKDHRARQPEPGGQGPAGRQLPVDVKNIEIIRHL